MLQYGEPTGRVVRGEEALHYLRDQATRLIQFGETFETILAVEAQTAAFGEVGEPGDPDHAHLAARIVRTYEELLALASELRGNVYSNEHFTAAAEALALVVNQPVESIRSGIATLCDLLVDAPAPLRRAKTSAWFSP